MRRISVPFTRAGWPPRSSTHCRISSWSIVDFADAIASPPRLRWRASHEPEWQLGTGALPPPDGGVAAPGCVSVDSATNCFFWMSYSRALNVVGVMSTTAKANRMKKDGFPGLAADDLVREPERLGTNSGRGRRLESSPS